MNNDIIKWGRRAYFFYGRAFGVFYKGGICLILERGL